MQIETHQNCININDFHKDLMEEIFNHTLEAETLAPKSAPLPELAGKYLKELKTLYANTSCVSKKWLEYSAALRVKFMNANSFDAHSCGLTSLAALESFYTLNAGKFLKILDLGNVQASDEEIHQIISHYAHIEGLFLNNNIKDLGRLALCQNLRILNIEGSSITSLEGLQNLTQLEELTLKGCQDLTDFKELKSLINLKYLDLSEGNQTNYIKFPNLKELKNLSFLCLFNTDGLTEHPEFLKKITLLKKKNVTLQIDIQESIKEALKKDANLQEYASYFN